MAKYTLTDDFCRKAPHPEAGQRLYFDDHRDAPAGFALRVTPGAKSWTVNYYVAGRQRRLTLPHGYPAWGPKKAREEAAKLKTAIHAGADPLAEREAARAAQAAKAAETERLKDFGLGALLKAYAGHLKGAGKPSHRAVELAVDRHIAEPFPKIAAMPAAEVTVDDVMPVFHKLAADGKLREAEKLRAYLRAAYTAARKARTDASMHAFAGFRIQFNPLADLEVSRPKEAAEKAAQAARERKWALSEDQLRAYWRRISADTTAAGALLRFHLLTGGQRIEQLARLTLDDYDADARTVTLRDTKGRRQHAHEHVVPLLPDAVKALEAMRQLHDDGSDPGPYLFTLSNGDAPAAYHVAWEAVQAVAKAMVEAEEIGRLFTPGTIRKTVETRLAAKGVPDEVLARLLSHGLGGVQARNYNAHRYDDEKRNALKKLRALFDAKGKVIEFPAKSG